MCILLCGESPWEIYYNVGVASLKGVMVKMLWRRGGGGSSSSKALLVR